jgi:two-component system, cell cycle sensor histidine kinase and response regulator CckA
MILTTDTKILISEDELIVADDLRLTLGQMGYLVTGIATTASEAIQLASKTRPNLVLMDVKLRGQGDGIHAASEIRRHFDIPVIFLTAHADTDTIHRASRVLPYGYLVKPYEENELRAGIEMALRLHQAQNQFSRLERFLSTTLASIAEGVIAVDLNAQVCHLNPAAERLTGWTAKEACGKPWREVFLLMHAETRQPVEDPIARVMQDRAVWQVSEPRLLRTRNHTELAVHDCAAPIIDERGNLTGVVVTFRDCTEEIRGEQEKKRVESRLMQTQKLESLGLLAGSFAHDFTNILASIIPCAEMLENALAADSAEHVLAKNIKQASLNAADLCHHILTFAGKGKRTAEPIELNRLLSETINLIHNSISKQARLNLDLDPTNPPIQGDPSQLRQLVMNLIINASDALEGKPGAIHARTFQDYAGRDWLKTAVVSPDLPEGNFVFLEIRDTGCGMPAATLAKIFDPFFTTKNFGRGLGLAAAHGIVRAHNGALHVSSTPGAGTVFTIAFPTGVHPAHKTPPSQAALSNWQGHGKVLLVDDDFLVRDAMRHVLQALGFEVHAAANGPEALEMLQAEDGEFRLLLADYTMPQMDGIELIRQSRRLYPRLPAVLMSGLVDAASNLQPGETHALHTLQKPFTTATLRAVLRQAMEAEK